MNAMPHIGVVGGSIGGLTAALVLRDLGCEVDVFERSGTALEARGAGIGLHPMTTRAPRHATQATSHGVRRSPNPNSPPRASRRCATPSPTACCLPGTSSSIPSRASTATSSRAGGSRTSSGITTTRPELGPRRPVAPPRPVRAGTVTGPTRAYTLPTAFRTSRSGRSGTRTARAFHRSRGRATRNRPRRRCTCARSG